MLSARGLRFRHGRGEPWLLDGADIDVPPGQVVGLWGPSGSGKSTLAGVLAGTVRPAAGQVTVDCRPLASWVGPRPVQLVVQQPERAMNPRWTIRRVLAEAAPDGAERAVEPDGLVDREWLDRYPHEISGGELQRVNLARALLVEPRYLLADEITSSLDALTQAYLWGRIESLVHDQGLGVLAVSHDEALLARVAGKILTISCGKIVPSG